MVLKKLGTFCSSNILYNFFLFHQQRSKLHTGSITRKSASKLFYVIGRLQKICHLRVLKDFSEYLYQTDVWYKRVAINKNLFYLNLIDCNQAVTSGSACRETRSIFCSMFVSMFHGLPCARLKKNMLSCSKLGSKVVLELTFTTSTQAKIRLLG